MNIINQCAVITLTSIVLIILMLVYSYNKKSYSNLTESFENGADNGDENGAENVSRVIDNELIDTLNEMKPNIQTIYNMKNLIYPIYSNASLNAYKAQNEFAISDKNFKFEEGKFAVDFYQQLQNAEINDLNAKYNDVKSQLDNLGLIKTDTSYNYIKHNISGIKLRILNYDNTIPDSNFNIMFDKERSMCIEYNAVNPDVVASTPLHKTINNINAVACDKASDMAGLSPNVKNRILKQKFKYNVIKNNTDYNNSLHPIYNAFIVPDYYQLNNYPYVIVYPDSNNNDDNKLVLTIYDGQMSIEPCSGADNQKFMLFA
jgi:hypothetical protein